MIEAHFDSRAVQSFPQEAATVDDNFLALPWIEASGLSTSSSVNGEPVALHHVPCISFGIRATADASTGKASRAAIARAYLMAAPWRCVSPTDARC